MRLESSVSEQADWGYPVLTDASQCPVNDRFSDTFCRPAELPPPAQLSVQKIRPQIYCLVYGQAVQARHADRLRPRLDRGPEPRPAAERAPQGRMQEDLRGERVGPRRDQATGVRSCPRLLAPRRPVGGVEG